MEAQLERASDFESEGGGLFESSTDHHLFSIKLVRYSFFDHRILGLLCG